MQSTINVNEQTNWYDLTAPDTKWLLDGLIPSDGQVLICGKPKCGKSTWIRCLVASVIKKQRFLGRSVDIPDGTGKVLYVHLDRKDQPWRVASELKQLGITKEESERLILRTAQNIPETFKDRLEWLKQEVDTAKPHLLVIDLLWQFLQVTSANDYKAVLTGINEFQDALTEVRYKGATIVAMHGRKATNPENKADDILGSTAQSGSFVTTIMLSRNRREGVYTIMSEQTIRDEFYDEIDECVIVKNPDGTLALGTPVTELRAAEAQSKNEADITRLLTFIHSNEGCDMDQIMKRLGMSKKRANFLMDQTPELIRVEGKGVRGDPHKYFVDSLDDLTKLTAMFGAKGGQNANIH